MFSGDLAYYIIIIPVLLISLTFHEYSHGYVAYRLGDITAKNAGRLSLNPLKHLDPVGTIMMVVARFGWAKPVPVDPFYFKDKKKGMMLVSVAGPLTNILLAFITAFPLVATIYIGYESIMAQAGLGYYLYSFLLMLFTVNLNLAIFNLIPVPPLDGSKILSAVLPAEKYFKLMRYEKYIGLVFLAVVIFLPAGLSGIISFFADPVADSMLWVAEKVVGIFVP